MSKPQEINDPAAYHQRSEPHNSLEDAERAVIDFWNEVYAAANKHGIAEGVLTYAVNYIADSGEAVSGMNTMSFGNRASVSFLTAFAYGQSQKEFRQQIDQLAAGNA